MLRVSVLLTCATTSGVKRGSEDAPTTPLDDALLHERWKSLNSNTPAPNKRTKH